MRFAQRRSGQCSKPPMCFIFSFGRGWIIYVLSSHFLEGTALGNVEFRMGKSRKCTFWRTRVLQVYVLYLRPRSGQRLKQISSVVPPKLKTADILIDAFCVTPHQPRSINFVTQVQANVNMPHPTSHQPRSINFVTHCLLYTSPSPRDA